MILKLASFCVRVRVRVRVRGVEVVSGVRWDGTVED
jgi:hypothetical protein